MGSVQEHVEHDAVVELIRREPTDHDAIRELWKKHSIAEDARDLPGLISTLTPGRDFLRPSRVIVNGESPIASVDSSVTSCTSRPMQEKHCSSFLKSARCVPLTNVTTSASMTSRSGDSQVALAGTQAPRNGAATLSPVIATAALQASAESASIG